MDLETLMYGYKKEVPVILTSSKYSDKVKSMVLNSGLPISFRILNCSTEKEVINCINKEKEIPIVIMNQNLNYLNLIKEIQEVCKNDKIQFIVILEKIDENTKNYCFDNTIFITEEMLNGKIFYNFFKVSLSNFLSRVLNDVNIRKIKRMKNTINKERYYLSYLMNSLREGIIILDSLGRIISLNKIAEHMLDLEDIEYINTPIDKYIELTNERTKEKEKPVSKCIETKKAIRSNLSILETKGERSYIVSYELTPVLDSATDEIMEIIFIFEDITLYKRLWDDVSRKKNLETLGLIAEGFVHDLNNQLTTMLANIHLLKETTSDESILEYIIDIENACMKSKSIVTDFIAFSKGGIPLKRKGNIKELIEEVVHLMFRGTNIRIDISAETQLGYVEFDHSLMAQVIKNVLLNAKEAVSHNGTIIVKIGNQNIPENNPYNVKGGKYVKISIEDDGIGIPQPMLDKIFDPNFSTKGKDRGLGLSIVKSIVENHNGFIKVSSRENVGTIFTIYLPVCEEKKELKEKVKKEVKKYSKLLIIIKDSTIIRTLERVFKFLQLTADFITKNRLTHEDLEKFIASKAVYDYLIIDTSGIDERNIRRLIEHLKQINPALKVIIMTHNHRFDTERANKFMANAILYKPFGIEEISDVLASVID